MIGRRIILTTGTVVLALFTLADTAFSRRACGKMQDWEEVDPFEWNDPWHAGDGEDPPEIDDRCDVEPGEDECEWRTFGIEVNVTEFHADFTPGYLQEDGHDMCGSS